MQQSRYFFFNSQNCIHAVYSKFIFEICYLGYLNFYLTSLKIVFKKKCKFNKVTMFISKTLDLSYFEKSRSHSIIQVASLLISFYLPYVWFDFQVNDLENLNFHQAVFVVAIPVIVMEIPLLIFLTPGSSNTSQCHKEWSIVSNNLN